MHLFDVIGPIMIGPSSSHTAGAAQIGYITRQLLGENPIKVDIGLYGSFAKTYRGHGTDKALVGGLLGMAVDDERLRNSLSLADDEGFQYNFHPIVLRGAHPNTVVLSVEGVNGRHITVQAASLGGGEIRVEKIDGMEVRFSGKSNTIIISYHDVPGMIAQISRLFAKSIINIGAMRVIRDTVGGTAVVVLEIDNDADSALLKNLADIQDVYHVTYLSARKEA